jgi:hypothetical protein
MKITGSVLSTAAGAFFRYTTRPPRSGRSNASPWLPLAALAMAAGIVMYPIGRHTFVPHPEGTASTRSDGNATAPALAAGLLPKVMAAMDNKADVVSVKADGQSGNYLFNVTIRSPDTGCKQYADWWEVLGEDGSLIYRRVLLHSHVDEQPFVRSGGPVAIQSDTVVWVRAHMNAGGYGGVAMKGSVKTGFRQAVLAGDFAAQLARKPPLPDGCDF